MLDLIIVTGASKGIGNNIAKSSFGLCKNMIVLGSSNKIKQVKSNICNVIPLKINQCYYNSVYDEITSLVNNLDSINSIGIVLCGSELGQPGGLMDNDLFYWNQTFSCNVLGNLAVIKGCGDKISKGIKTRIAFFAGGGAAYGYPEFSGYAMSKVATVREVENLSIEFKRNNYDASIIAVAPGAVNTDMLKTVLAAGGYVKTTTDISEPTNFVINFIQDKYDSKKLNGKFLHVRDDILNIDLESNNDLFTLRRLQ